ncbi:MAG TPA: hypothetical protein VJS30_13090 [Paraburkholderia sp.]|nr:hypothetical protein [Paraburkholderia sp.]
MSQATPSALALPLADSSPVACAAGASRTALLADAFDGLVEVGALEVVADLVAGCVALLRPPDELLVAVPPEPSDEPPPPQAVSRKP